MGELRLVYVTINYLKHMFLDNRPLLEPDQDVLCFSFYPMCSLYAIIKVAVFDERGCKSNFLRKGKISSVKSPRKLLRNLEFIEAQ